MTGSDNDTVVAIARRIAVGARPDLLFNPLNHTFSDGCVLVWRLSRISLRMYDWQADRQNVIKYAPIDDEHLNAKVFLRGGFVRELVFIFRFWLYTPAERVFVRGSPEVVLRDVVETLTEFVRVRTPEEWSDGRYDGVNIHSNYVPSKIARFLGAVDPSCLGLQVPSWTKENISQIPHENIFG